MSSKERNGNFFKTNVMSAKILRVEGRFEVIGYFMNDVLVRTSKRLVTNWK